MENPYGILSGKFAWKICLEDLFGIFKNYLLEFLIFKNGIYLKARPDTHRKN
jgi:hypothetical protein